MTRPSDLPKRREAYRRKVRNEKILFGVVGVVILLSIAAFWVGVIFLLWKVAFSL